MHTGENTRRQDVGPESVSQSGVSGGFHSLWWLTGKGPPLHRDSLVVVTEERHLRRVKNVLNALPGDYAARQALVVTDTPPRTDVSVCLVNVAGEYVERLEVHPGSFRPEMLEPLVYPAMINHVWWACERVPTTETLRVTARLADQIILDTLTEAPTLVACSLSDRFWQVNWEGA